MWHFDGNMGSSSSSATLPSRPSPRIKIALWLLPVKRALIGIINRELRWEAGLGREGVSGCHNEGI